MRSVVDKGNKSDKEMFESVSGGEILRGFLKTNDSQVITHCAQPMLEYNDCMKFFNDNTNTRDYTVEC